MTEQARFLSRRAVALSGFATIGTALISACGGGSGGGSSGGGSGGGASSASSSSSSTSSALPDPSTAPALKTVFAAKFKIGMAIEPTQTTQNPSRDLLIKHASSITAENVMKPATIGPSEGVYDYSQADQLITFAQANGIAVRGHTLVWHQTAPNWFFAGSQADPVAYKALVRLRLETYVTNVVTHFKGKVYAWDVVNEVASDTAGETYRNSAWYQALGPDYIEYAFRAARAADPTVKLYINDYSTEDAAKRTRLIQIVQDLLNKGVPIDGVGHQAHLNTASSVPNLEAALTAVEALNLENHVTELDVSLYTDPGSCYANQTGCAAALTVGSAALTTALRAQAVLYRSLYTMLATHPSVKSVTTWGVADDHTWLKTWPVTRLNLPLLFDEAGLPKSAFWASVDPAFVP